MKTLIGLKLVTFLVLGISALFSGANSQENDASVMLALKKSLNSPQELGWLDPDPCKWDHVGCSDDKRVTRIQIGHKNLQGNLPQELSKLTELERLELQWNNISGPLPSLSGLSSLQVLMLSNNQFSFIPADFFAGMSSLQSVEVDNNPFLGWEIPESLKNASSLKNFSANSANVSGKIPSFLSPDEFPGLVNLHLALNNLEGELPSSFSGLLLESLWLNGQKLRGGIDVLQNMTFLKEVWLHSNGFSGPLPDFSGLKDLEVLNLRDNSFTGPLPASLANLESLKFVNLTNNLFQGPMPKFKDSVSVDLTKDTNSFCLPQPGDCDPRVNTLLSIAKAMDYPRKFAENWKGNNPCADWFGLTCTNGNITIVNFQKMGLSGTIAPEFASLKSLQRLVLADNNLTGTIPEELTTLTGLAELDVSNNQIYGKVPAFRNNMILKTGGNPDIGKDKSDVTSQGSTSPGGSPGSGADGNAQASRKKPNRWIGIVLFSVIGGVFVLCLIGAAAFCLYRSKQKRFSQVQSPNAVVMQPRNSGSDNDSVKITVAGSSVVSVGAVSEVHTVSTSETGDIQMVEAGNMVISIQVLKNVTNNFSEENILGQGGFGTVYKGELHDGTKIAVKRMECGFIAGKGLTEFKSEIAVLTKVRHRHLVGLLGYCLDGNEKLLVYEYMPQGTLSSHLFNWREEALKPLEWTKRLIIALDVARGVEYLHSLAHQSFIHRDLKPSNILLGDDMRAKVADFGLVRLAPEGKGSIETRIAGTFGYLAPEYAVTGRVTTKVFKPRSLVDLTAAISSALLMNEPQWVGIIVKPINYSLKGAILHIDTGPGLTIENSLKIEIESHMNGHPDESDHSEGSKDDRSPAAPEVKQMSLHDGIIELPDWASNITSVLWIPVRATSEGLPKGAPAGAVVPQRQNLVEGLRTIALKLEFGVSRNQIFERTIAVHFTDPFSVSTRVTDKSTDGKLLLQVILQSQVQATLTIYDSWLDLQEGFAHTGNGDKRPISGFFPLVISPKSRAGILFSICLGTTPVEVSAILGKSWTALIPDLISYRPKAEKKIKYLLESTRDYSFMDS